MSFFIRVLDHLGWVLAAFLGFLSGLLGRLVGQIFDGSSWLVAIGGAAFCGVVYFLISSGERIFDRLFDGALNRIFLGSKPKTVPPRHLQDQDKELRYPSWIAFIVGVIVAFIAGSIFSLEQIMSLI